MPTLYDLSEDVAQLELELEIWAADHDGDISEFPLEKELEKLQGDLAAKVLKIAVFIKNLKSDYEAFKEEKKALQLRQTAAGNRAERLKAYLEGNVPYNADYKSPQARVKWQKNPPACILSVDVNLLPEKYLKPREADLEKLKADMAEFQIDDVDGDGKPHLDADGKPGKRTVKQVRWPGKDGAELVLAEMRSKLGLRIQ